MEKEFVPYEQSHQLKELGFDEPCFGYYQGGTNNLIIEQIIKSQGDGNWCLSPTFSQAFRWFREKYNLYTNIDYDWNDEVFRVKIMKQNEDKSCNIVYLKEGEYIKEYNCYEEAELACLIKLIEIIKNK